MNRLINIVTNNAKQRKYRPTSPTLAAPSEWAGSLSTGAAAAGADTDSGIDDVGPTDSTACV